MAHPYEDEIKRDVLKQFASELMQRLSYRTISSELHRIKLSDSEIEGLNCRDKNDGNASAVQALLLDHFRRRIRYWDEFLSILRKYEYYEEAQNMEDEWMRRSQGNQGHNRQTPIVTGAQRPPAVGQVANLRTLCSNISEQQQQPQAWHYHQQDKLNILSNGGAASHSGGHGDHMQARDDQTTLGDQSKAATQTNGNNVYQNVDDNVDSASDKESLMTKRIPSNENPQMIDSPSRDFSLDIQKESNISLDDNLPGESDGGADSQLSQDSHWCDSGLNTGQRVDNVQQEAQRVLDDDNVASKVGNEGIAEQTVAASSNVMLSPTVERGEKGFNQVARYDDSFEIVMRDEAPSVGNEDQQDEQPLIPLPVADMQSASTDGLQSFGSIRLDYDEQAPAENNDGDLGDPCENVEDTTLVPSVDKSQSPSYAEEHRSETTEESFPENVEETTVMSPVINSPQPSVGGHGDAQTVSVESSTLPNGKGTGGCVLQDQVDIQQQTESSEASKAGASEETLDNPDLPRHLTDEDKISQRGRHVSFHDCVNDGPAAGKSPRSAPPGRLVLVAGALAIFAMIAMYYKK